SHYPPREAQRRRAEVPVPHLPQSGAVIVVSFDGSASPKRGDGSCAALVWDPCTWKIHVAAGKFLHGVSVNEAEYHGVALALTLAAQVGADHLLVFGDSNQAI
ncbi:TPA: hypothetical protein N0F65_001001, partial [Lagenidium giganteum]